MSLAFDAVVRRNDMIIDSDSTRGRGRHELTLDGVVKKDIDWIESQ